MTTALEQFDAEVLEKITGASEGEGYRPLDLISELNSHTESEVQKVIAELLLQGRIQFTHKRRLKRA